MGLQMPVTTRDGRSSPASYSKVVEITLSRRVCGQESHVVTVDTYNSKADRLATPPKDPIKTTVYIVKGADCSTYFSNECLDVIGCNPTKQAYSFLKAHEPVIGQLDFRAATDA